MPTPATSPRRARHARRAAALATCLALLTAGCSHATNRTTYTPTWTPTPTATASPTPTLSPEHAAALAMAEPTPYTPEFTPEGAAEAATYFLNLFPYVFATGNLDAWQNMSSDDCSYCNTVINNATELHEAGGWTDPWEQEITPLECWIDDSDPNRYVIRTNVISQAHTEHPGNNAPSQTVEQTEGIFLLQVYWSDNWTIEAVQLEDEGEAE